MLQLVYISSICSGAQVGSILRVSRRNNARDGITGLLYHDGRRFLQALEGDEPMVDAAFARISADARHRAVVVLSRRTVGEREFGAWEMAECDAAGDRAALLRLVEPLLKGASPNVRGTFEGFMRLDRAA